MRLFEVTVEGMPPFYAFQADEAALRQQIAKAAERSPFGTLVLQNAVTRTRDGAQPRTPIGFNVGLLLGIKDLGALDEGEFE